MFASNFQLDAYLQRIQWSGPVQADTATLTRLMQQQLRTIPFENLDVQAGKVVSLVPEDIVAKIVGVQGVSRRGGYCYELNGLFAMALTALDIKYQFVFCRPMFYPMLRPKTHMALIVEMHGERWLCDLGFGSYGMRAPIALSAVNLIQDQEFDRFQLIQPEPGQYVLQAFIQQQWVSQFGFDLYPAQWIDFMPANYLNSTHPETVFVQKYLVILQHATGRTLLAGNELKTSRAGMTEVRTVAAEEFDRVLNNEFGLVRPSR